MSSSENQEVWLLFPAKIKFPVLSILKTGLMTMTSFQFTWFNHLVQFSKPHCGTFCTPFELRLHNINNYAYALQNSEKPQQLTYAIPISKTHIPMPHQNQKKKTANLSYANFITPKTQLLMLHKNIIIHISSYSSELGLLVRP